MKVLHIIDSLGLGGAQTVVKGIFEAQKDNLDMYLYSLRMREITVEVDHLNVKIQKSKSKYTLSPLLELKHVIGREKIEILHCHLFRSQVFGWLLKKIWFPHIKLIFHEHGEIFYSNPCFVPFLKVSARAVDTYIAVSKATRDLLVSKATTPKEKIQVLYNFVDIARLIRLPFASLT